MTDNRLTNNTHETSFGDILKERSYFRVPPFQRAYKWKKVRLEQLIADINQVKEEEEDAHFIGAFIIDTLPTDPNDARIYEVIDGQQRLTTFYLLIAATVRTLLHQQRVEEASELALNYLFTREGTKELRASLISSIPDLGDMKAVIDDLWGSGLKDGLSTYTLVNWTNTKPNNGQVLKNYEFLCKHTLGIFRNDGEEALNHFISAAQSGLTVVQIVVKDPTSGPKIFDSLNSKQEPMTTSDLVRNEIFSKVAREDPEKAAQLDVKLWQPFYESFKRENKEYFEGFFFPYGLIQDPGFKKSDVYSGLRKTWLTATPEEVLKQLESFRLEYQDLVFGENSAGLPKESAASVFRLSRLHFPRVALPFLMQVSHAIRTDQLESSQGIELYRAAENFLMRRALCSLEPTGLHAVFKRLWGQLEGEFSFAKVREMLGKAKTVTLPTDRQVIDSFEKPMYGKKIARFFVHEYDISLGGDPGSYENMWVEHVCPNAYHQANWPQFTRKNHENLANLAGNLIPLSKKMNNDLGQGPYLKKAEAFKNDSMFKSARSLALTHDTWEPRNIEERNRELAEWAIARWPF
jgi:uncharacterized protein with ParB-like and HNH nuclease domain